MPKYVLKSGFFVSSSSAQIIMCYSSCKSPGFDPSGSLHYGMWLFVPYASAFYLFNTIFILYLSLRSSSMICLYLVPRIPVCDHRRFFLYCYVCTLTEIYMCGSKQWTKAHSWRGLARNRTGALAEQSLGWHDAMRCEDQLGSHPAN